MSSKKKNLSQYNLDKVQNGKDLTDIAGSCADYFNCKSIVARASNKRGTKSQIQTFMEFEKLRKQEVTNGQPVSKWNAASLSASQKSMPFRHQAP